MSSIAITTIESKTANAPPVVKESGGNEVGQFTRSWVNFDGTGTVAIQDSFNVSSITDNGVGDYSVNFANALPNVNYAVAHTIGVDYTVAVGARVMGYGTKTTGLLQVKCMVDDTGLEDQSAVNVSIFANN